LWSDDLECVAQVETQLTSETTKLSANIEPLSHFNTEPDWNAMNLDMDLNMMNATSGVDNTFDASNDMFGLPKDPINPSGDYFSTELLALGLQEPLPGQDVMDEL